MNEPQMVKTSKMKQDIITEIPYGVINSAVDSHTIRTDCKIATSYDSLYTEAEHTYTDADYF